MATDKYIDIKNRNREFRGTSRARIQIIDTEIPEVGLNTLFFQGDNLPVGAYLNFHYFPSSMSEVFSQNWDADKNQSAPYPILGWKGSGPRVIKFKLLFNELGDNIGQIKYDAQHSTGNFLASVSDSLQFIRRISSNLILGSINPSALQPPYVGVFGLLDKEIFSGVVNSSNIEITHWGIDGPKISSQNSLGLGVVSPLQNANVTGVSGIGKRPLRATVDIEIIESYRNIRTKGSATKVTGK